MKRALILCTGNSCRSQMAEAFLNYFGEGRLEAQSAGTRPSAEVHPLAVEVMREEGLDISFARPKSVDEFIGQDFDYVITVCDNARETCPIFSGKVGQKLHVGFEDPAEAVGSEEEILAKFREVRNQIKAKFREFAENA
ncbi:MAG: arsenate reductase ArsC [Chloroflexota bacterium]